MRPLTRWLLVALVFVFALFVTPKLHALYQGSLSLTDIVASQGGERRIVRISGGESAEVVVHRQEYWSHCPGLGVVAQSRSARPDSLILLADALFRAFRDEAAKEPPDHRCMTVTLEPGVGRQDPLNPREQYAFSLWRSRRDQRWVLFTVPEDAAIHSRAMRVLGARWPRARRSTSSGAPRDPSAVHRPQSFQSAEAQPRL